MSGLDDERELLVSAIAGDPVAVRQLLDGHERSLWSDWIDATKGFEKRGDSDGLRENGAIPVASIFRDLHGPDPDAAVDAASKMMKHIERRFRHEMEMIADKLRSVVRNLEGDDYTDDVRRHLAIPILGQIIEQLLADPFADLELALDEQDREVLQNRHNYQDKETT